MTAGDPPARVVGSPADGIDLFPAVEFVKESHPVLNRAIHIGGEERTEASFLRKNPIPVSILPNQRLWRTVASKDGEVVMAWVVPKKREDGIVALFPVGSVDLMMGPNLHAIVETVPLPSKGIDQELRSVFSIQMVASRKDLDEKVLEMNRAVGKINGKDGEKAHEVLPDLNFSNLASHSERGRSHRSQSERACCWRYSNSARCGSASKLWRRESIESQSDGVRPGIKRERLLGMESGLARPRQPAATASLRELPHRRLGIIWTK